MTLDALLSAAETRRGSRDVEAWLFTSMLRSVGVQARLVCSLQPLQFTFLNEGERQTFHEPPDTSNQSSTPSLHHPSFPPSNRSSGPLISPADYLARHKTFSPSHPYFWTEAFSPSTQRWIPISLVGPRLNQPSKIEPPLTAAVYESGSVGDNLLTYVVGFDNGIARGGLGGDCRGVREGCY
jgi:xeroderma pigmentosum group C-complementing protein